jgi:hypothetical protein
VTAQGRNDAGQVGLFPKNHTSANSPLAGASRPTTPKPDDKTKATRQFADLYVAINKHLVKPFIPMRLSTTSSISISEISSDDADDDDDDDDVERFKKARTRLAERARRQLDEARAREEDFGLNVRLPTIDVDMDNSESESDIGSAERERLFDDEEGDDDVFMRIMNSGLEQRASSDVTPHQSPFMSETPARTTSPEPLTEGEPKPSTPTPPATDTPTPTKANFSRQEPSSPVEGSSSATLPPSPKSSPSILQTVAPIQHSSSSTIDIAPSPISAGFPSNLLTWTVAEVVNWLQLRDFNDEICSTFLGKWLFVHVTSVRC